MGKTFQGAVGRRESKKNKRVEGSKRRKRRRGNIRKRNRRGDKERKEKKAPGPDGIPNEAWKYATMEVKKKLGEVINGVWRGEGFPTEWRTGNIIPIYKKGDKEEVKNYRGITLMDTGYKIYAEIIRRRLEAQIEEERMLEETQQGFRKKREAVKAIYLMKKAIEKEIGRERDKVFAYSLQT